MLALLALLACDPSDPKETGTPPSDTSPETSETDTPTVDTAPDLEPVVTLVAGVPGTAGRGLEDVPATASTLYLPQDMTPGPDDVLWVDDYNDHIVREVRANGTIHTILGSGFPSGGDGGPALEEPLDHPTMVLPDPSDGNVLWVAATGNHRIGRLDRAASVVSFPYGNGYEGYGGDGGPAAQAMFARPSSVAFDDAGNLYVSDRMNQVVRRIDPQGTITTVAGTPGVEGYAGDGGPATGALLSAPAATETDPGNRIDVSGDRLVIADTGNDVVREVDLATGTIRTLAAGFTQPHDVAIASDGTVYVADTGANCVRAIASDGSVTDVAGRCGEAGPAVDGVAPGDATFDFPAGVAVRGPWLWVADCHNHVIRKLPR